MKKTERKSFIPQLKLDTEGEGTFEAVFATFNVIDKDGDITLNGAIGSQKVLISQYNHGSWREGVNALPIGVGEISERGEEAIVKGKLNLDMEAGRETYKSMKFTQENGHTQEFSYALPFIEYEYRTTDDGKRVRVLKKITVPEVSPVLMGAGNNTRMLNIKGAGADDEDLADDIEDTKSHGTFAEQIDSVLEDATDLVKRFQEISELRKAQGKTVSSEKMAKLKQLREIVNQIPESCDTMEPGTEEVKAEAAKLFEQLEIKEIMRGMKECQ